MNTRLIARTLIGAIVLLALVTSVALAGGWAVITLDELPGQITAGQAFSIGFTVRQHGRTLRSDLTPIVRFNRADTQESFQVTAQRQGAEGHYAAEIKFPGAGQWEWQVDVGLLTQDLPTLTVRAAQAGSVPAKAQLPLLARIVEFVSAFRQALTEKASTPAVPASLVVAQTTAIDQVALGKALFSAKGCVMCHAHAAVKVQDGPFGFGDVPAPNLSEKRYGAEYLRLWLHDPQAVKPQTPMPKLQLSDRELEALIAFLQAEH
jgi:cytochrome c551/c552